MTDGPLNTQERWEKRDGMLIGWDVGIPMDDGVTLRSDVFLPMEKGEYPVIMSYGIYGKGVPFADGYAVQWEKLVEDYPEVLDGSSGKYQNWETADPERWVPDGYAIVRVDSRGAGRSPGTMDPKSPREIRDFYECIEWAGTREWSSGKVGLLGISYYAHNQWRVAAHHPPHLTAMIPWEGFTDWYREPNYHGGILSTFVSRWARIQVLNVQFGLGDRAPMNPNTGESISGGPAMSDEELAARRVDLAAMIEEHPLLDDWYRERTADLSSITTPFLSAANWGGQGLHLRGNLNGFTETPAAEKWLEIHGDTHWAHLYSNYGVGLQKRFFDHFLKGIDSGWRDQPRVQLNVRHADGTYALREEREWPLARTQWTDYFLDAREMALKATVPPEGASVTYSALDDGLTFLTEPFGEDVEITGPVAAIVFVSSSTADADLFVVVRAFDPEGGEVTFQGALDPNTPVAQGWLRASHRRIDSALSKPFRPVHPHDRQEPLEPGEVYELAIEIWPTCVVLPAGYRLGLSVRGTDYEYTGPVDSFGERFHYATRGTGGMTHDNPKNRPSDVFGGQVTLYTGPDHPSRVVLPFVPPQGSSQ